MQVDEFLAFSGIQGCSIQWCALGNGGSQASMAHSAEDGGDVAAKLLYSSLGLRPAESARRFVDRIALGTVVWAWASWTFS
jgi:hypothetical protein